MAKILFDAYLEGVQIIVFAILIIIMMNHRRKYGVQPIRWIIGSFSFALIEASYEVFSYLMITYYDERFIRFETLNLLPFGFAIMMIYFFAESIYGESPHPLRMAVIMFLLGMSYSLLLYQITLDDPGRYEQIRIIYDTIFDAFQITAMGFVTFVFYRCMQNARDLHFTRINRYLVIATSMYVITATIDFIKDLIGFSSSLVLILYTVSVLLIAIIYLKYPFYVFSVPEPIYSLIISSINGELIYRVDLQSVEDPSQDELFVSAIAALNKLFSSIFEEEEIVKSISFQSQSTMICQKKGIVAILLTKRKTKVLKASLDKFLDELLMEFPELNEKQVVYKLDNTKIIQLISRTMPYLDSNEVVSYLIK